MHYHLLFPRPKRYHHQSRFRSSPPLGTAPIIKIQYPYLDHPTILTESAPIIDFLYENVPGGSKFLPAKYRSGQERAGMETNTWKLNKFYFAWGEESLLSFAAVAFARDCPSSFPEYTTEAKGIVLMFSLPQRSNQTHHNQSACSQNSSPDNSILGSLCQHSRSGLIFWRRSLRGTAQSILPETS